MAVAIMNDSVTMGPITVHFQEMANPITPRRASGYQRKKPEDWIDDDLYIAASPYTEITATFSGGPVTRLNIGDEEYLATPSQPIVLEDGANELVVFANGLEYYCCVYLVRACKTLEESSGEIMWDDGDEIFYFAAQGFFDRTFSIFRGPCYLDEGSPIEIEGDPMNIPFSTSPTATDGDNTWPLSPTPDSTPRPDTPVPDPLTNWSLPLVDDPVAPADPAPSSDSSGSSSSDSSGGDW